MTDTPKAMSLEEILKQYRTNLTIWLNQNGNFEDIDDINYTAKQALLKWADEQRVDELKKLLKKQQWKMVAFNKDENGLPMRYESDGLVIKVDSINDRIKTLTGGEVDK